METDNDEGNTYTCTMEFHACILIGWSGFQDERNDSDVVEFESETYNDNGNNTCTTINSVSCYII